MRQIFISLFLVVAFSKLAIGYMIGLEKVALARKGTCPRTAVVYLKIKTDRPTRVNFFLYTENGSLSTQGSLLIKKKGTYVRKVLLRVHSRRQREKISTYIYLTTTDKNAIISVKKLPFIYECTGEVPFATVADIASLFMEKPPRMVPKKCFGSIRLNARISLNSNAHYPLKICYRFSHIFAYRDMDYIPSYGESEKPRTLTISRAGSHRLSKKITVGNLKSNYDKDADEYYWVEILPKEACQNYQSYRPYKPIIKSNKIKFRNIECKKPSYTTLVDEVHLYIPRGTIKTVCPDKIKIIASYWHDDNVLVRYRLWHSNDPRGITPYGEWKSREFRRGDYGIWKERFYIPVKRDHEDSFLFEIRYIRLENGRKWKKKVSKWKKLKVKCL